MPYMSLWLNFKCCFLVQNPNSMCRLAQVEFEKPDMTVDALIEYGRCVVDEQENVQRVQLAESYLSGAELAGIDGKSIPDELVQRIKERKSSAEEKEQKAGGSLLG